MKDKLAPVHFYAEVFYQNDDGTKSRKVEKEFFVSDYMDVHSALGAAKKWVAINITAYTTYWLIEDHQLNPVLEGQ